MIKTFFVLKILSLANLRRLKETENLKNSYSERAIFLDFDKFVKI